MIFENGSSSVLNGARYIVGPHPKVGDVVKAGVDGTLHTMNSVTGRSVPVVQGVVGNGAESAIPGLAAANAVLAVANLAVGIYTAYQTTKVRQELGQMHRELSSGISQIRDILDVQTRKLDLILEAHARVDRKLDAILLRIEWGFDQLSDAVRDVVVERRADELRTAIVGFLHAQDAVAGELAAGASLDDELTALLRSSTDLRTRADSQLMVDKLPVEARQPLVAMSTAAAVAEVDCLLLREDSDIARDKASRRLMSIEQRLLDESGKLHEGASPWDVARFVAPQSSAYRLACATLTNRRKVLLGEPAEAVEIDTVSLLGPGTTDYQAGQGAMIELQTLSDYSWFIEAFDEDPETFDLGSVRQVPRKDIEARLGAEALPIDVDALRELARPSVWRSYSQWASSWIGRDIEVRLSDTAKRCGSGQSIKSGPIKAGDVLRVQGPCRVWLARFKGLDSDVTGVDLVDSNSTKTSSTLYLVDDSPVDVDDWTEYRLNVPHHNRFSEGGIVGAFVVRVHINIVDNVETQFEYINRSLSQARDATWSHE